MRPIPIHLAVFFLTSSMLAMAADDPLQSFTPDKPGLRFIPSTPAPVTAANKMYPAAYIRAVSEVIKAFRARDWEKTELALTEADKIHPPSPVTLNTRGAMCIEQKDFKKGASYCEEALKLDPKFYPARFNLAEIELMERNYAAARKIFEKFVRENSKDELARFRVFLTYLLEENYSDARRTIDLIPFPGDTPAYYYANAAWDFAHKRPEEAKRWIGRANWTFVPDKCATFDDSIYELGWLERPKKGAVKVEPGESKKPDVGVAPGLGISISPEGKPVSGVGKDPASTITIPRPR
ncbi:MAG: hypothetical protein NTX04_00975 [Verrucomicrobia bacterium]|nr:hypothetical protein [Verrucomicrobiota bacterium]